MCDHYEEREEEEQKSSVDDDLDNFDGGDVAMNVALIMRNKKTMVIL